MRPRISAMSSPRAIGHRDEESRACIHQALGPHLPAVAMDDPLHGGKADSSAFESVGPVETLEDPEELVHVSHVEADAVVPDEQRHRLILLVQAPDLDLRVRTL